MLENIKKKDVWHEIDDSMLPLACPLPEETLWDKHPRVYLPIKKEIKSMCPYCGNKFVYVGKHKDHA